MIIVVHIKSQVRAQVHFSASERDRALEITKGLHFNCLHSDESRHSCASYKWCFSWILALPRIASANIHGMYEWYNLNIKQFGQKRITYHFQFYWEIRSTILEKRNTVHFTYKIAKGQSVANQSECCPFWVLLPQCSVTYLCSKESKRFKSIKGSKEAPSISAKKMNRIQAVNEKRLGCNSHLYRTHFKKTIH